MPQRQSSPGAIERFMGGRPLIVALKLALVSLLVGFVMVALGVSPWDLFVWVQSALARLWREGLSSLREIGTWVLFGAVIVVPVWIILRLLARTR